MEETIIWSLLFLYAVILCVFIIFSDIVRLELFYFYHSRKKDIYMKKISMQLSNGK